MNYRKSFRITFNLQPQKIGISWDFALLKDWCHAIMGNFFLQTIGHFGPPRLVGDWNGKQFETSSRVVLDPLFLAPLI